MAVFGLRIRDFVSELHHGAKGFTVFTTFERSIDVRSGGLDFGNQAAFCNGRIRDAAFEALDEESCGTAGDIDVFADQVGVSAGNKVAELKSTSSTLELSL